jgi:hypothetical protein
MCDLWGEQTLKKFLKKNKLEECKEMVKTLAKIA